MKGNRKMAPDGAYSGKYGGINEYEGEGKERFLREAAALLREVAKHLLAHGFDQSDVHASQSGVMTSGEVSGMFWRSRAPEHRVVAYIDGCLSTLGGRKDGVDILARTQAMRLEIEGRTGGRRAPKEVWRHGAIGPNQWISPACDSAEIAAFLAKIFDPATSPADNHFFSKGRGEMALPDLVLPDNSLATQLTVARQWYRCAAADREDAVAVQMEAAAAAVPAPSVQMSLFAEVPA